MRWRWSRHGTPRVVGRADGQGKFAFSDLIDLMDQHDPG